MLAKVFLSLPFTAFNPHLKQNKRIPKSLFHRLASITKKQGTSLHKKKCITFAKS